MKNILDILIVFLSVGMFWFVFLSFVYWVTPEQEKKENSEYIEKIKYVKKN